MLQATKYKELETFRNLSTIFTGTITRFHYRLHVDMHEQVHLVPTKRSVNAKFQNSRIEVEFVVLNCNNFNSVKGVIHRKKNYRKWCIISRALSLNRITLFENNSKLICMRSSVYNSNTWSDLSNLGNIQYDKNYHICLHIQYLQISYGRVSGEKMDWRS